MILLQFLDYYGNFFRCPNVQGFTVSYEEIDKDNPRGHLHAGLGILTCSLYGTNLDQDYVKSAPLTQGLA